MKLFALACLSIALSVAAQFLLKAGMSSEAMRAAMAPPMQWRATVLAMFQPHIVGGFLLYGLGALAWLAVLSRWDVSKAYPMVGLGFIATVAVGVLVGEQVGPMRVVGVSLIVVGVALVARS